jgi:CspA family cold shock protein
MSVIGIVKFFKTDKGYGFLETQSGDFFFHATQVTDGPLEKGEEVEFELGDGRKGDTIAVQVRRVPESE